jgi:xanthine/uracil/vitamin C permease (AzgA family)
MSPARKVSTISQAQETMKHLANKDSEVRRDLVTATAAIAGMATITFGIVANLPVAIAYVGSSQIRSFPRGVLF